MQIIGNCSSTMERRNEYIDYLIFDMLSTVVCDTAKMQFRICYTRTLQIMWKYDSRHAIQPIQVWRMY